MAKATKPAVKKSPAKPKSKAISIEQASYEALAKLKALNIEPQLQAEIEWCIGSYNSDKNPIGLYEMVNRAIAVFQSELQKKTKGVTAKFVGDLRKSTVDGD